MWELEVGHTVAPNRACRRRSTPDAFDDPNTLGGLRRRGALGRGHLGRRRTPTRPRSAAAPTSRPTSSSRCAERCRPPARTCCSPTTSGWARPSRPGLVIQELLLRHRARTVVIVCPPSLSLKWQDEMREKFGLDFVDRQQRADGAGAPQPWPGAPTRSGSIPRVIVSMAWLPQRARPAAAARRLRRGRRSPAAPAGSPSTCSWSTRRTTSRRPVPVALGGGRGYAVDSHRTVATRELASRCEHRLFLTATPHNGHSESFTALLEMIDSRRFSRGAMLDEHALREVDGAPAQEPSSPTRASSRAGSRRCRSTPTREEQEAFASCRRCSPTAPAPTAASAPATSSRCCSRSASCPARGRSPGRWSYYEQAAAAAAGRLADLDETTTSTTPRSSAAARATRRRACRAPRVHRAAAEQGAPTRSSPQRPAQLDRLLRLGARLRAPARLAAAGADHASRRGLPSGRAHVDERAGRRLHRVRRDPRLDRRRARPARLRAGARDDPRRHPADEREHIRARFTEHPAKDADAGAGRHRLRGRGHRPAGALPPAGQLRRAVQPVPAGAADRPHRPLRPAAGARDLPLRARLDGLDRTPRTWPSCAGSRRRSARRRRPRLGEPGHRRRHPAALRPNRRPRRGRRAAPDERRRDHHPGAGRRDRAEPPAHRAVARPTPSARWRCT